MDASRLGRYLEHSAAALFLFFLGAVRYVSIVVDAILIQWNGNKRFSDANGSHSIIVVLGIAVATSLRGIYTPLAEEITQL
ncbi:hypothetical protein RB195_003857 [Necator americanus]|uniref:Uncharacterized protein n=1 Tax=Necator americanus TaxID=51031 RepID=A0ABR1DQP6_NECAM